MIIRNALVVDDDNLSREFMAEALRASDFEVSEAASGAEALKIFDADKHEVVFTDIRMPDGDGEHVLRSIKALAPQVPVVLVTAFGTVECAVNAMKAGAEDFIMKPVSLEQIELTLTRLAQRKNLRQKNKVLKVCLDEAESASADCVGESRAWKACLSIAHRVARTNATVLIRGESGSGKEVIASEIHRSSLRSDEAFIRTNCAVLHDNLLSSELFGHEKGAFTGAHVRKEGRFELANGGTLFLDEIGEISPEIQAKLLRVLETGEFERVGGKETLRADVRVVCATNRNLEEMMTEGTFRDDLYYRLNVVPITVPALRERREDIALLTEHFLGRYAREFKSPAGHMSEKSMAQLEAAAWPGNVRELANIVQRAVLLANTEEVEVDPSGATPAEDEGEALLSGESIAEMERRLILGTLRDTAGNKAEAARRLGVTARTLSNKLKGYRERGILPAPMAG